MALRREKQRVLARLVRIKQTKQVVLWTLAEARLGGGARKGEGKVRRRADEWRLSLTTSKRKRRFSNHSLQPPSTLAQASPRLFALGLDFFGLSSAWASGRVGEWAREKGASRREF
ncbi:hypothetical protein GQ54DRAFT_212304 [Martensiomyces pterosporus]|nr:hypothetical protein GQ54DRAFT_212304 [Martensiomyces pterosporus]